MVDNLLLVAVSRIGKAALPPSFQLGQAFGFILVIVSHEAKLQLLHSIKQYVLRLWYILLVFLKINN